MKWSTMLAMAAILAASAQPALAQPSGSGATLAPERIVPLPPPRGAMPGMAMPGTAAGPSADASPSTAAFKAADDRMMQAMGRPMTGDADQDFVSGMLPHHGGAVDMARVELQYGKDPDMLKLARGIVAAQEKEIAQMQAWRKRHARP